MTTPSQPGALVISLDFELHWGMRDHTKREDPNFADLSASRTVVVDLANLFARRGIRATWATVGFLFASKRQDIEAFSPEMRPNYGRQELDPFVEPVGDDEASDPEHLAGSLVELLSGIPGQEVASHTFSHYYCLEAGQDIDSFRADLAAAQAIARSRNLRLTSLVLPRNQWNPLYAPAVLESGFNCFRGPQPSRSHEARRHGGHSLINRGARLADAYFGFSPPPTASWDRVRREDGLCDVRASAFLRPFASNRRALEPLRIARLKAGLRDACRRGRIFHLWWHPHNFSRFPRQSFELLNTVLDEFDRLAHSGGMRSFSMRDIASIVGDTDSQSPNSLARRIEAQP
jgi:peptidoglycan/xylan/chitin deacetylase (PgdA/CDA1 family)